MVNKFKDFIIIAARYILYLYILVGLVILIILYFNYQKGSSLNLGPLAILLASQIAGFSVINTINNTNKIEQEKEKEEKRKTHKVLSSYFRHNSIS